MNAFLQMTALTAAHIHRTGVDADGCMQWELEAAWWLPRNVIDIINTVIYYRK
jgi:hypothetical protein